MVNFLLFEEEKDSKLEEDIALLKEELDFKMKMATDKVEEELKDMSSTSIKMEGR